MSEEKTISMTKNLNTMDTIYQDLIQLGIKNGDILLVHSSLSSIGWVCGGPQTVILALLNAVGKEGTLVMPAHSGDWSDPSEWQNPPVPKEWVQTIYDNMPAFDPELTPTRAMGCIAELFRNFPNTMRSNHPQVSFCAKGRYAKKIIEKHRLTPQFGIDSPLGQIHYLNAKVLLLGVGYDNCTSFHLAEALTARMPKKRMGTAIKENETRVWKWFEDFEYDSEDFSLIGKEFEETINIQKGKVGNAECKLFRIQEGVEFAQKWLLKNRFNL